MDPSHLASVQAIAALEEPTRRQLYELVARSANPVSKDEAANALAIPRTTAAFHLDKLVSGGLLSVVYERRSSRRGPGAGRPAKLYRRSDQELEVSLPERTYDVAALLLAAALVEAESTGDSALKTLARHATHYGKSVGQTALQEVEREVGSGAAALGIKPGGVGSELESGEAEPEVESGGAEPGVGSQGLVLGVLAGQGFEPRVVGG